VVLLVVGAFLAGYGLTRAARHGQLVGVPARPAPLAVLASLTAAPQAEASNATDATDAVVAAGNEPAPGLVRTALASAVAARGLGGRLLARVVDAQTGVVLYDRNGSTPAAPASTAQLLTAAAILAVHKPSDRFATTVLGTADGTIVLVGGGDPTLSAVAKGRPPPYEGAARLTDLVAQIERAKVTVKRIVIDDSLFVGPSVSPDWVPSDLGTSYGSGITAVMTDGGRPSPTAIARSVDPDLAAGAELAAALGDATLPVTRGVAPVGARRLARVESAPLSDLITEMLQTSDNTIAEVLARQVAVAEHVPASFRGATAAIRTVLARLGVQVGGDMLDGSGLSAADRVSPAALVAVLRLVVGAGPPAAALPVGGWSGTLAERYNRGGAAKLAGQVRAKTGTLSGVSSLAGFVHDRSGRLLLFSFDADRALSTSAADAALDGIVVALGNVQA
jgi:D-alanyl-D-alanine carboxypeptidase/D-alanyl-D-alanine-endopeptidase (penicillin-binding protein 4)